MPAYFIASYIVTDTEKYMAYAQKASALVVKHGGKALVVANQFRQLEGEAKNQHVILEFPSEQAANAWYNDPDYQAVIFMRLDSTTDGSAVIAPGFVPPDG